MATIRDVAKLAGVSSSTVSLTFGESHRVSADTAQKVWAAANRLGYQPNPFAQSLKRGHSQLVGVVLGDFTNPFFGGMLREIERYLHRSDYNVMVASSDSKQEYELEVLDQLAAQRLAGIILMPHGQGAEYIQTLKQYTTPIVTLDHRVPETRFDYVGSDSRLAAAMLTEHLIRLGHRRVAQISGPPNLWSAAERIRGFNETLAASKLTDLEGQIVEGSYFSQPAYGATMRLMTSANRPTAILAANNVMALGALQAIRELGFRCPDDVSLAAIDTVPWNSIIQPSITYVQQDIKTLAQVATGYLLDRIETSRNGEQLPPRETLLTPRLFVGESTGPVPG